MCNSKLRWPRIVLASTLGVLLLTAAAAPTAAQIAPIPFYIGGFSGPADDGLFAALVNGQQLQVFLADNLDEVSGGGIVALDPDGGFNATINAAGIVNIVGQVTASSIKGTYTSDFGNGVFAGTPVAPKGDFLDVAGFYAGTVTGEVREGGVLVGSVFGDISILVGADGRALLILSLVASAFGQSEASAGAGVFQVPPSRSFSLTGEGFQIDGQFQNNAVTGSFTGSGDGFDLSGSFTATRLQSLPPPLLAVSSVLPTSRSVSSGDLATLFMSVINAGNPISDCAIAPVTDIPASFEFAGTDPATNMINGQPNAPFEVGNGGLATFVLSFQTAASFAPTFVTLAVACQEGAIFGDVPLLSAPLLAATNGPVADVIAVARTLTGNGIAELGSPGGISAFSTAAFNVGAEAEISATPVATEGTPVNLSICETDPAGACSSEILPSLTISPFSPGERSFAIFVTGQGVPFDFDPATRRVNLEFRDLATGNLVGSTGVAVSAQ